MKDQYTSEPSLMRSAWENKLNATISDLEDDLKHFANRVAFEEELRGYHDSQAWKDKSQIMEAINFLKLVRQSLATVYWV